MAKGAYIGVNNVARKIKKGYIGIENFTKRNLPAGYTQVEYIEGTGSQYYNTGYSPKSEVVEYEFSWEEPVANSNCTLFGSTNTTSSTAKWPGTHYKPSATDLYSATGSTDGATRISGLSVGAVNYGKTVINNGSITRTQNGTTSTGTYSGSIQNGTNIGLFADIRTSDVIEKCSNLRFRYWKMKDNGVLVRDLVPCINSAGVAGFYDMVNGTFGGDAAGVGFVAGPTYKGVARKIRKAYIGIGGIARPCWSGGELAYYGTVTALSAGRDYLAAASNGKYAVFSGGIETGSKRTGRTDAYDASLTRTTPDSLSGYVYDHAGTRFGSFALFLGGYATSAQTMVCGYNESLTRQANMGLSGKRCRLAATTIGNLALAGGGYSGSSYLSTVESIKMNGSYFEAGTVVQLSVARESLAATTIGDYALFAGGMKSDSTAVDTVDAFNSSLTRTTPSALTEPKRGLAATTAGDYALFAGGQDNGFLTGVVAYDKSLTRTAPASLSVGRADLSATSVGGFALFGGGTDGFVSYLDTVDSYDASLTRTTATALSAKKTDLAATTIGNFALFGGGLLSDGFSSAVDAYTVA